MGTDIHLGVERFTGSQWEPVDGLLPTESDYTILYESLRSNKDYEELRDHPKWWATNRNYDVFALLAGVRNGVGFAGRYRCEPVEPCFPDRGIPSDTSLPTDGESWLGGDHSFTHFTYKEAMQVPWNHELTVHGLVAYSVWVKWKASGDACPEMWCSHVGGTEEISEEKAEIYLADGVDFGGGREPYVRTYFKRRPTASSGFRRWLLSPEFQRVVDKNGAENVRICVSFDS